MLISGAIWALLALYIVVEGLVLEGGWLRSFVLNVDERVALGVLSSMDISAESFPILIALLDNPLVNMQPVFAKHCQAMSVEAFKQLLFFATHLQNPRHQSLVLAAECVEKFTSEHNIWSDIVRVRPAENVSFWCRKICKNTLSKSFLASVDLAALMTRECLVGEYRNKARLVKHLNYQLLKQQDPVSHLRLALLAHDLGDLFPKTTRDTLETLSRQIEMRYVYQFFTGHLLGCHSLSLPEEKLPMLGAHLKEYPAGGTDQATIVQAWVRVSGLQSVLASLSSLSDLGLGLDLSEATHRDLEFLFQAGVRSRKKARNLFRLFGAWYDDLVMERLLDGASDGHALVTQLPHLRRLEYYRRTVMRLPQKSTIYSSYSMQKIHLEHILDPKAYIRDSRVTLQMLQDLVSSLTSNPVNFITHKDSLLKGVLAIRPRIWMAPSSIVDTLNIMVYSLVAFGLPAALLPPTYCSALLNSPGARSSITRRDYKVFRKRHDKHGHTEDFPAPYPRAPSVRGFLIAYNRNFSKHKQALKKVFADWRLEVLSPDGDLCDLLSDTKPW